MLTLAKKSNYLEFYRVLLFYNNVVNYVPQSMILKNKQIHVILNEVPLHRMSAINSGTKQTARTQKHITN